MLVNGVPYRTIWPDPVDPSIIRIIDQRHLPHRFVLEALRSVDDVVQAISEMHVRGAGLIGAAAGFGVYLATLAAPEHSFSLSLQKSADKLILARPTARNLAWAVERMLTAIACETTLVAKREKALVTAREIADEDAEFCRQIGCHGLSIIKEISNRKNGAPVNILTHCNAGWLAFVDYGSATAPIYAARQAGVDLHVWVDETRPWLQGAKLTAWELAQEGVPYTLIVDNAGGHLMQHGLVDLVIVGSDRTTRTGDVANKIGTYLKAIAAQDNNIPFYVALPSSTIDWQISDGLSEIPIEQRSADEVNKISGLTTNNTIETISVPLADTPAANFGFDVTPARLVTGLITERGVVAAAEKALLSLFPEVA